MKTGKFIALGHYRDVKIGYGTVDYKNLKTIYIKLNSWLAPENEDDEFDEILSKSKRKIKLRIFELQSALFKKESIVDLDVRTKGIKLGKKSFLNLEITLFTKDVIDIRSNELKTHIKNLIKDIIDCDLNNEILFNFYKNKK
jgi:hypothetical protein